MSQRSIAAEQLEVALHLWFTQRDYFAVITLAGAAEEILGSQLSARGAQTALASLKDAVGAVSSGTIESRWIANRANNARNASKHGFIDEVVDLDPRQEARDMLSRAIDNYWRLHTNLSPAMERFQREEHTDQAPNYTEI